MTWGPTDSADRPTTGSWVAVRPPRPEAYGEVPPFWREAARRAVTAARDRFAAGTKPEVLSELLVTLVTAVARGPGKAIDERLRSHLGRGLLDELRGAAISLWCERAELPPEGEVLNALRSIEAVRLAIEPDWSQYFGSRLSGPDGLNLVVEVAHDLRSPLTSILFLAEVLQSGQSGMVTDLQRRQCGLIYSAALGLSEMASNVIELARGGDQLAEKEPAPFSLQAMLDSVLDLTRPMAEEKGLIIRSDAPNPDQRRGYPIALNRVLLNLTTNAIKFTEEGFVELVVKDAGSDLLEFSVRDTGRGMSPDALANLYTPFRRVAGQDRYTFSGTGLGLTLCKRLVEAMGGNLEVETRPQWGTRFHFEAECPADDRVLHGLPDDGSVTDVDRKNS